MTANKERPLEGKTALITGATGLLGAAIAERFHSEGVKVILNYFRDDKRAEQFKRFGEIYKADINDVHQFEKMIGYVRGKYGRLDILINNYGPILYKDMMEIETTDFQRIMLENIMPVFNGCRLAGGMMKEQEGQGRIINIAAAGAEELKPKKKTMPYFIGKNAVIMLTRSFAQEYAPYGITVNAVSPGIIEGSHDAEAGSINGKFSGDMNMKIESEDIASVICFLCSDEAGSVSGQNINVSYEKSRLTR